MSFALLHCLELNERFEPTLCLCFQGQSLRLKLLRRYFSDDKQYLKSLHQPLKGKPGLEEVAASFHIEL